MPKVSANSNAADPGAPRVWTSAVLTVAMVFAFVGLAGLLPPDTALSEIQKAGVMRACLPVNYPPLVNANAEQPGIDVEILGKIAERLGLRLAINSSNAIGNDINPRNWRINRAQCQILGGGVVTSTTTRSYLDTTPPHLEIGWAVVTTGNETSLKGQSVGFYAGFSGFDRIALSKYLRATGAKLVLARSAADLVKGLQAGDYGIAVTESLAAREIADANSWTVRWLGDTLPRYPIAFGLWKGDLTFKRAVDRVLAELDRDGTLASIIAAYHLEPIAGTFAVDAPVAAEPAPVN